MDESIDHYLCTSEWSDANPVEASTTWGYEQQNETKQHLASTCGEFANSVQALHAETASSLATNCMPSQYALGGHVDYVMGRDMFSGGAQIQKGIDDCLNGLRYGWIKEERDVAFPRLDSCSYEALQDSKLHDSEELPSICHGAFLPPAEIGSIGCNSSENFDISFGETLPPVYDGNRVQAFSSGGRDDMDNLEGSRFVDVDNFLQLNDFSASITPKDKQILQSEGLSSLATESTIAEKTMETGQPRAAVETTYAPSGFCNISEKPRVRARRGQATDPHSIAERLRREKISERMKSLQELVPNSSKTDKASMLDEIIEYVRFLQLQVKVLSMSRLGAAEAVVPLISAGSKKASVSFPSRLEGLEFSPSSDEIAVEKEIVKLMETNVSKAVQYLQSRGLCLMPVPLASAISDAKAHERDNSAHHAQNKSSSSSSSSGLS